MQFTKERSTTSKLILTGKMELTIHSGLMALAPPTSGPETSVPRSTWSLRQLELVWPILQERKSTWMIWSLHLLICFPVWAGNLITSLLWNRFQIPTLSTRASETLLSGRDKMMSISWAPLKDFSCTRMGASGWELHSLEVVWFISTTTNSDTWLSPGNEQSSLFLYFQTISNSYLRFNLI